MSVFTKEEGEVSLSMGELRPPSNTKQLSSVIIQGLLFVET